MATWLRTWYELYAKPNVRTATANRYQLIIEVYTIPRIGSIKLKKLTIWHLQKLYKKLLGDRKIHLGKYWRAGRSTTSVHCVFLMPHTALQNGADVKTVSSMLGHYDAGFTLRTYTHATRQKQDEAAQTTGAFMEQVM